MACASRALLLPCSARVVGPEGEPGCAARRALERERDAWREEAQRTAGEAAAAGAPEAHAKMRALQVGAAGAGCCRSCCRRRRSSPGRRFCNRSHWPEGRLLALSAGKCAAAHSGLMAACLPLQERVVELEQAAVEAQSKAASYQQDNLALKQQLEHLQLLLRGPHRMHAEAQVRAWWRAARRGCCWRGAPRRLRAALLARLHRRRAAQLSPHPHPAAATLSQTEQQGLAGLEQAAGSPGTYLPSPGIATQFPSPAPLETGIACQFPTPAAAGFLAAGHTPMSQQRRAATAAAAAAAAAAGKAAVTASPAGTRCFGLSPVGRRSLLGQANASVDGAVGRAALRCAGRLCTTAAARTCWHAHGSGAGRGRGLKRGLPLLQVQVGGSPVSGLLGATTAPLASQQDQARQLRQQDAASGPMDSTARNE
jgi:hypothetical protein